MFVTAVTVVGTVILAAFAAYAIARNWDHKFFRWSFFYLLAAMFLPFPVLALSQVKLTGMVGLANPVGVALLHVMFQLSFSVLLFTAFIRGTPGGARGERPAGRCDDLGGVPAHRLPDDGAHERDRRDLRVPRLVERLHDAVADHPADSTLQTLPVLQNIFQTQFSSNYNVAFASYLMAMTPAIIVYLFTQRWVMSGVTQGAIK